MSIKNPPSGVCEALAATIVLVALDPLWSQKGYAIPRKGGKVAKKALKWEEIKRFILGGMKCDYIPMLGSIKGKIDDGTMPAISIEEVSCPMSSNINAYFRNHVISCQRI